MRKTVVARYFSGRTGKPIGLNKEDMDGGRDGRRPYVYINALDTHHLGMFSDKIRSQKSNGVAQVLATPTLQQKGRCAVQFNIPSGTVHQHTAPRRSSIDPPPTRRNGRHDTLHTDGNGYPYRRLGRPFTQLRRPRADTRWAARHATL